MPPKKSRAPLIIALSVIGAIVVVGGIAAAAVGVSSSGGTHKASAASSGSPVSSAPATSEAAHSIRIPGKAGDYRRMHGSVADRTAETMRKSMAKAAGQHGGVFDKAKVAIYSKGGGVTEHPLVFIGLPGNESPELKSELQSRSASDEVDSVFLGMGVGDAKDYPAGHLGGVLRCAKGSIGTGGSSAVCAWADKSVVGMVMTPLDADAAGLAKTTLALRNAAEH